MLNQFKNLSCYEEFEIQCALIGISKVDILKAIGNRICNYYFFVSHDGIFNWFNLKGNHIEDPGVLKTIKEKHIPKTITKCIIPDSVTRISEYAFYNCKSLKEVIIPDSVIYISKYAFASCYSLNEITIPNSVVRIDDWVFYRLSLKKVIFKGKTLEEVEHMNTFLFGIEDESIIKCEI